MNPPPKLWNRLLASFSPTQDAQKPLEALAILSSLALTVIVRPTHWYWEVSMVGHSCYIAGSLAGYLQFKSDLGAIHANLTCDYPQLLKNLGHVSFNKPEPAQIIP